MCELSVEAQVHWHSTTKVVKFPNDYHKMERTPSEEEKQKINALLERHQPREEKKEKEMVILSEKGKKISIKTEVALRSMKPFGK